MKNCQKRGNGELWWEEEDKENLNLTEIGKGWEITSVTKP